MKKYINNLEEKVSSVLNESLVSDAAELVGIEEEDAEERIKGLSFANYIELGNAIDLEDAETAREILSTVAPIEEGKLAKAAAIGTMALGLGAGAIDQGAHADDILDQPTPTVRELADMHDVPVSDIASQLAMGIKAEKEHTSDPKVAKEIALDHLRELPDYYAKLEKMEETASAGGTGAASVGVSAVSGDIGTWDGKAHKKPKKGLKNAGKGVYESEGEQLYHVTHTKYIPQIQKSGLRPMGAPSNWVQQGSGDRYGMGEIYVFTSREDAKKWAGRMDWDFNQTIGSGDISIITLNRPEGQDFEKDEADPMSQAGQQGEWLKTYEPIEPENIVGVQVFKSMNEADNPYASAPSQGSSVDALAQQTQQAEPAKVAGEEEQSELQQRKEVDDLSVGDDIEVIDIDGDPTAVTVKTPRGPGDTLVVQTDKGEEHIVKKQAVSGTPTIQEMYENALREGGEYGIYRRSKQQLDAPDGHTSSESAKVKRGGKHVTFKNKKEANAWIKDNAKGENMFARKVSKPVTEDEDDLSYESALTDRVHEAYNANKTEHSGAKKGKGGYHGRKKDAKRDSNKKRRQDDKKALDEVAPPGMEDWIKKRKPDFKKQYGDRWEEVLYATAWKRHNESIEESDFEWQQADTVDQVDDLGFDPRPEWGTRRGDIMRVVKPKDGLPGLKVKGMSALLGVGDWVELDDGTSQKIVKIGLNTVKLEDGKFHSIKKIRYPIDESLEEGWIEDMEAEQAETSEFNEREWAGLGFKYSSTWPSGVTLIALKDLRKPARAKFKQEGWQKDEGGWWIHPDGQHMSTIEFERGATTVTSMPVPSYFKEADELNEIRRLAGLKETASAGATGAAAVATAPTAMGGMVKRNPSIYNKPKPKKRTKESSDDGLGRSKKK